MNRRTSFLDHLGQTNQCPYLIDVDRAEGIYIWDKTGKRYMDMIAGVAVSNVGHNHPLVIDAIKTQVDRHLHVMVYGEYIQDAQLAFSDSLRSILPNNLNSVYPVNSGTEANEAALKLAKRVTGRTELVAFKGSYHGSTHGSMSVSANETKKEAFRPLIPDVRFLTYNDITELDQITRRTAGVIIETIQGDAGVRVPDKQYMEKLRERCDEVGALLIFDEIQCGFGRTGKRFAFEYFDVVPDVLTLGKALGGGMPIGALVSSKENLHEFTYNPMLGHITTFGGHPVVCAAGNAAIQILRDEIDLDQVEQKGELLEELLKDEIEIIEIRRIGMMFALDMESFERVERVVKRCLDMGLISFWFLSHPYSFRLSPPLTISEDEIREAARIIRLAIAETRD